MTIRRGDILWADLGMFPTTSVQGGVRPVIVVSNNKANTYSSVITVCLLYTSAKQICPEIIFVRPRMDLYLRFSQMAREIYSAYTDKIEPYGIDYRTAEI